MDVPLLTYPERRQLAERLRSHKFAVAETVTAEFLRRHPDWTARYGDLARVRGLEDACYHVDFLAGAIEAGSAAPFVDYVHWTTGMLGARGIDAHFVAENLEQIGLAVAPRISDPERPMVEALLRAGSDACASPRALVKEKDGPLVLARSLFVQAILGSQRKAALNIALEALREGASLVDVYVEVFQMALYDVGRLWAANEITVAQEHMATAIAQYVVAQVYSQLPVSSVRRGSAVITGVEGELHQIGANMVADVLESHGWEVRFLGTQMPHQGIVDAVEEHRASLLGISATMLFNVPQVTRLLASVRQRLGDEAPKILLGGAAFRDAPALWEDLGAIGYGRDLRDAIRLAGG